MTQLDLDGIADTVGEILGREREARLREISALRTELQAAIAAAKAETRAAVAEARSEIMRELIAVLTRSDRGEPSPRGALLTLPRRAG